jgi:SAM-dependent methyltransferase
VESYRRYRPGYPAEIVERLRSDCGLREDAVIVDVASGTGLLAEIFLAAGFAVTAIEPNDEMRAACASLERDYPKLRCVAGTAEATGLANGSVDLITVAQAMHWFDRMKARAEFARVLKPDGWCAVIYNDRRMGGDAFHDGYERLLREFGVDYLKVQRSHVQEESLREFFAPGEMRRAVFPNQQTFDLAGLEGRVLSSSYMPHGGHPRFAEMRTAMARLFAENERDGAVTMEYECVVSWGALSV